MTDAMHLPEQQNTSPQRYAPRPVATLSPLGLPAAPPAPPALPAPPAPPVYPPLPGQPSGSGGQPFGSNGRPRRRRRGALAAAALALAVAAGTTGGVIGNALGADGAARTPTTASSGLATSTNASTITTLSGVVEAVAPSIVTINIQGAAGAALGSGVILDPDGLVLTNNHVVADGGTITVDLADGRTVPATLVGTDATHDLAVIQLQGVSGLTAATLGDSDSLTAGQTVLAFGSPLGLEGTVTSGIVSALHRETTEDTGEQTPQSPFGGVRNQQQGATLTDLIQTDAAINSGNSGGALVDTAGRVIGINVAIATTGDSTGNIGVGFAIPINTAKTVVQQITGGAV
ncbi:S1C family serine protease [Catenuloplanes atrovinosus]|uniref:Serine protease PepD n=1 Tax=Catenuloplanes atrovinosus TaxID=137266 RepID=A0AAE3YS36_9ACTN|nr:trypsin-like peptidase domain-containing protein [Catenuloplanes atrovinosus]MDR7278197.1 putative serine protease PepD [Catenuloplanes atrovinosus]